MFTQGSVNKEGLGITLACLNLDVFPALLMHLVLTRGIQAQCLIHVINYN